MALIIDLKNAIRRAIYEKDDTINFNFNEILTVEYPYIYFYIPNFKIDKALDTDFWRKISLDCVVEYAKSEDNTPSELWSYMDTMVDAYKLFDFADTKLSAINPDFRLVEGVLQMTFSLNFYAKILPDEKDEIMKELDLTITEEIRYGVNAT